MTGTVTIVNVYNNHNGRSMSCLMNDQEKHALKEKFGIGVTIVSNAAGTYTAEEIEKAIGLTKKEEDNV